jgi:hypothetical protein
LDRFIACGQQDYPPLPGYIGQLLVVKRPDNFQPPVEHEVPIAHVRFNIQYSARNFQTSSNGDDERRRDFVAMKADPDVLRDRPLNRINDERRRDAGRWLLPLVVRQLPVPSSQLPRSSKPTCP